MNRGYGASMGKSRKGKLTSPEGAKEKLPPHFATNDRRF
jgi:hypothetical protein